MGNVIVDTDFLNHIIKTPSGEDIMQKIVNFYGYEFVMHPWVFEREIKNINTAVEKYVTKNIEVLTYSDFLKTKEDEVIYDFWFRFLYREMNHGIPVDGSYRSFKTYNKANMNIGEIHSVILSRFLDIPLLLSDDYNAKEIAVKRINTDGYELNVKKSIEIICDMVSKDNSILPKKDIIPVIRNHKKQYWKSYINQINSLYKN